MYSTWAKLNSLKVLGLMMLILTLTAAVSFGQKTANKGGGGTPAPTPVPTPVPTNPLPQTPPSPDILYRESFGEGPDILRPTGGKGTLKTTYLHTNIQNFWIEYPGSKNTQWLASDTGDTWRYCAASDNPYEMYSPLQMTLGFYGNGCVASEWFEVPANNPVALMPYTAPNVPYEISFNGYPAPINGKYLALGVTNSTVLYNNLQNSGNVVLVLKPAPPFMNFTILYELRLGGMNGTLLSSGETYFDGWNRMKLRIDPLAQTVSASVNDTELGTFAVNLAASKYAGFEGVGIGDNFIIRKLQ